MGKTVFREIPGDVCGYYDNLTGAIHIDRRMPADDQHATYTHELFHKILGHGPAPSLAVHTSREVAVERLTARHLITLPRLIEVLVRFGTTAERAAALGVNEAVLYARVFGLEEEEQLIIEVCARRCIGLKMTPAQAC